MLQKVLSTAVVVAALALQSAHAHSKMTLPKPNSEINNSPSGTIDGPSALTAPAGKGFGTSPEANTAAFLEAFKGGKYKSIRELVYAGFKPDGASTKECGQSAATGPAQALPDSVEYGGGFDSSHQGPCEVWCDDTMVFYNENCAKNYPAKPAKLPYDKSKCAGAKRLQSFWLALHVPAWQAYISCATLGGGGTAPVPAPGGGNGAGSTTTGGGGTSGNAAGGGASNGAAGGGNTGGNTGGNNNGGNNNGGANDNIGGNNNNTNGGNNNNSGGNNSNGGGNNNNNNNGQNNGNNGGNNNNDNGGSNGGNNNQNNRNPTNNGGFNNNNGGNNNNNGGNNNTNGNRNNNNGGNNGQNSNNGQRSYGFSNLGKRQLRVV